MALMNPCNDFFVVIIAYTNDNVCSHDISLKGNTIVVSDNPQNHCSKKFSSFGVAMGSRIARVCTLLPINTFLVNAL